MTSDRKEGVPAGAADRDLRRKLAFSRRLNVLLFLIAAVASSVPARRWIEEHAIPLGLMQVDDQAPYAEEVRAIIKPLRYSIAPILLRNDVRIDLDFDNQRWHLRNLHRFDAEGNIALEEGRYGVCGELSAHVYGRLKKLVDPRFEIAIARVAQSGFFPAFMTEHFAIEITDRSSDPPKEFLLDSSLKRYGPMNQFEDYLVFERLTDLAFMETHAADQSFRVGSGTPVEITGRYLVVLSVERQGGVFNRDNFRIALVAFHRHHYLARPLLFLRSVNGEKEVLEYPATIRRVLTGKAYGVLREKLIEWFDEI